MGIRLLVPNLVVPGHVVSELRGMRFSGFPFEWDMAYNNLPCTNVQAVKFVLISAFVLRLYSGFGYNFSLPLPSVSNYHSCIHITKI
jgi:hypothetical protein